MTTTFRIIRHKPTGRRYICDIKRAWSTVYFSCDGGATWHQSRLEAFTVAAHAGRLREPTKTA